MRTIHLRVLLRVRNMHRIQYVRLGPQSYCIPHTRFKPIFVIPDRWILSLHDLIVPQLSTIPQSISHRSWWSRRGGLVAV